MTPFKYSVNVWLITEMPTSMLPPRMENQSPGTPYEPVGVIEFVPLDRLEVGSMKNYHDKLIPYLVIGGKPSLVNKYVVTTTKVVAYGQLQNPMSDLHNVHYCMPVLL